MFPTEKLTLNPADCEVESVAEVAFALHQLDDMPSILKVIACDLLPVFFNWTFATAELFCTTVTSVGAVVNARLATYVVVALVVDPDVPVGAGELLGAVTVMLMFMAFVSNHTLFVPLAPLPIMLAVHASAADVPAVMFQMNMQLELKAPRLKVYMPELGLPTIVQPSPILFAAATLVLYPLQLSLNVIVAEAAASGP